MPRTVDPEKHRAKREHIMHAAGELFATHGFEGTSTARICEAAGISTGNLFHYFGSKRELFAAVLTSGEDETSQRLATALAAADPLTGLLDFVDHLAAAAADPMVPALVVEAMMQACRDPGLARLLGDDAAAERAGVRVLLVRAAEARLIDPRLAMDETAGWITAMVGAVYLSAATDEHFDAAGALAILRLTVERLLRPSPGKSA